MVVAFWGEGLLLWCCRQGCSLGAADAWSVFTFSPSYYLFVRLSFLPLPFFFLLFDDTTKACAFDFFTDVEGKSPVGFGRKYHPERGKSSWHVRFGEEGFYSLSRCICSRGSSACYI